MLNNRTWVDRNAEVEFWKEMEHVEALHVRLSASGRWHRLFRRSALQRDLAAARTRAQDLVDRHTILIDAQRPQDISIPAEAPHAADPLHRLAGMVVSLKQDRVAKPETGEERSA